jgi:hypothetical protein
MELISPRHEEARRGSDAAPFFIAHALDERLLTEGTVNALPHCEATL